MKRFVFALMSTASGSTTATASICVGSYHGTDVIYEPVDAPQ